MHTDWLIKDDMKDLADPINNNLYPGITFTFSCQTVCLFHKWPIHYPDQYRIASKAKFLFYLNDNFELSIMKIQ